MAKRYGYIVAIGAKRFGEFDKLIVAFKQVVEQMNVKVFASWWTKKPRPTTPATLIEESPKIISRMEFFTSKQSRDAKDGIPVAIIYRMK